MYGASILAVPVVSFKSYHKPREDMKRRTLTSSRMGLFLHNFRTRPDYFLPIS
jgi:hypothetical protein